MICVEVLRSSSIWLGLCIGVSLRGWGWKYGSVFVDGIFPSIYQQKKEKKGTNPFKKKKKQRGVLK